MVSSGASSDIEHWSETEGVLISSVVGASRAVLFDELYGLSGIPPSVLPFPYICWVRAYEDTYRLMVLVKHSK